MPSEPRPQLGPALSDWHRARVMAHLARYAAPRREQRRLHDPDHTYSHAADRALLPGRVVRILQDHSSLLAPSGSGYLAGHCVRSQSGSRGEGNLGSVRALVLSCSTSGTGVGHALMRGCVGWR
jgi:hypothetical protein